MAYFVYILKSKSAGKYYVGSSSDPERTLQYHNTIEKRFTSRYRPWQIIFKHEFKSKSEAQLAERKIKSWKSIKMIEKLIFSEIKL